MCEAVEVKAVEGGLSHLHTRIATTQVEEELERMRASRRQTYQLILSV